VGIDVLKKETTMIVGIDVNHPPPDSTKGTPSISCVVSSVDDRFFQYPASLRLQESRRELVLEELTDMLKERLEFWKSKNGNNLPKRILVFRDGVSEGQYKLVIEQELPCIQRACLAFSTGAKAVPWQPKITIAICTKRHDKREYPGRPQDADEKTGNPKPGTVIDQGITDPFGCDFLLQAHGAIKGTARPTHYQKIYDDFGYGDDDFQRITHALSYSFARATKAVSLVTPAYFADVACTRGKCYLRQILLDLENTHGAALSRMQPDDVFKEAKKAWGPGIGPMLRHSMFYL